MDRWLDIYGALCTCMEDTFAFVPYCLLETNKTRILDDFERLFVSLTESYYWRFLCLLHRFCVYHCLIVVLLLLLLSTLTRCRHLFRMVR